MAIRSDRLARLAPAAAVIAPAGQWRRLTGAGFGLRQSCLVGALSVGDLALLDFSRLDASIATVMGEAEPRHTQPDPDPTHMLIACTLDWVIAIQHRAMLPVSHQVHIGAGQAMPDGRRQFAVALDGYDFRALQQVLEWTVLAVNRLLAGLAGAPDPTTELTAELDRLATTLRQAAGAALNQFHLIRAANDLAIPVRDLGSGLIGLGSAKQMRLLNDTITDATPSIGVGLARRKVAAAAMLRRAGLPAAAHFKVDTEQDAVRAAGVLKYPVVVKPGDLDQGVGVAAGLRDERALREAFRHARRQSAEILIEKHYEGQDYRLTVLNGRVVKIMQRVAGSVTGDGKNTVAQLVAQAQQSPRMRKFARTHGKMPLELDEEALGMLRERKLAPESVPPRGTIVVLRRQANISTGGEQLGLPIEQAHPDNLALAISAARQLRLDIAGVDLIAPDIATSWRKSEAIICEVNAQPQIGVRNSPEIYQTVLRELVGESHGVPCHLVVTGSNQGPTEQEVAALAAELGCNGWSGKDGVWIDGVRLAAQPLDAFHASLILSEEREAEAMLCVLPAIQIIRSGLPSDRIETIRFWDASRKPAWLSVDLDALLALITPHLATPGALQVPAV